MPYFEIIRPPATGGGGVVSINFEESVPDLASLPVSPADPINTARYVESERATYLWNGSNWVLFRRDDASVIYQPTAPGSPLNGDLWVDTDLGVMFQYDNVRGVWLETNGIQFVGAANDPDIVLAMDLHNVGTVDMARATFSIPLDWTNGAMITSVQASSKKGLAQSWKAQLIETETGGSPINTTDLISVISLDFNENMGLAITVAAGSQLVLRATPTSGSQFDPPLNTPRVETVIKRIG